MSPLPPATGGLSQLVLDMTMAHHAPTLRSILAATSVFVLASCATGTDYAAPDLQAPASFAGAAATPGAQTALVWWSAFRDPTLNGLMDIGVAQNLDVRQAIERITEARASERATLGNDLPTLTLNAGAGRSRNEQQADLTSSSATLDAGWVIDLFGGNRAAKRGAKARVEAAYLSADLARLTLLSEIALTYIDLRYYQELIALTKRSVASRKQSLGLIQSQFDLGAATRLDLLQAEQLVAIADAQLPALEIAYHQQLNRLATLTAQPVQTLRGSLLQGAAQPRPNYKVTLGVPAEVLRQRPDIRLAERNFAAAAADVGVAEAALYPSLSLGGTVTAVDLRSAGSLTTWSFGPQINLPIFTGGRTKANLTAAESRAAQSRLAWQQTVLIAVEQIENALAAYNRDGRNTAAQQRLLDISAQTLDMAKSTFELGEGNFLSVLDAEAALLDARKAYAQAVRQRSVNYVQLSAATVGGVLAK
jgi:outer membrane protein, multidrug efflux system